tara:strand:- start:1922 stop:2596 length:675 start_codon:yes stop_codon:yes gene_type:complete
MANILDSKLYWSNIFNESYIRHPQTIAYSFKGVQYGYEDIQEGCIYISKPITEGGLGIGVQKVDAAQARDKILTGDNVIVQEYLKDCKTKSIRYYRFVSLYDGTEYLLYMMDNPNKSAIAGGRLHGGTARLCIGNACDISQSENSELSYMMDKLSHLHNEKYPNFFCIGWDIMLNCNVDEESIAYALEGNIICSCWFYPDVVDTKIVSDFKQRYKVFYNKQVNI